MVLEPDKQSKLLKIWMWRKCNKTYSLRREVWRVECQISEYFFYRKNICIVKEEISYKRRLQKYKFCYPSPHPYSPLPRPPQHYATMSNKGTERQVQSVSTKLPHSYWFLDGRKYFLLHRSQIFPSHSLTHVCRINSKNKEENVLQSIVPIRCLTWLQSYRANRGENISQGNSYGQQVTGL